jgi:hypothetical protein
MELWQYFWHESVYDKRAVLIMRIWWPTCINM